MKRIALILLMFLMVGCSATRYVPQGKYLLRSNEVKIKAPKGISINKSGLEQYIQQHPNRRLLGMGIYLGFYNITDTAKHGKWHTFWSQRVGEAPVIYDSTLSDKTCGDMEIYLDDLGFLNGTVTDSVVINKRRKAKVIYRINVEKPYTISSISYDVRDDFLRPIVEADTVNSLLKVGRRFERKTFEDERMRIVTELKNRGFWGFNQSYVSYTADSTMGGNKVAIKLVVRRLVVGQGPNGRNIYANHPIYRIKTITVNSAYDPTASLEQINAMHYDTTTYNDVAILYHKKQLMRSNILIGQLGMSPGELYDQQSIEQTYTNVRSLGYNASILFTPLPIENADTVVVTQVDGSATTTERQLSCLVQCTPTVRQNFSVDFEAGTTSDYYSLALKFGYQNRNLFNGAEDFNVAIRGAYEFIKVQGARNSFEFGVSTSLRLPRFLLPISPEKMRQFSNSSTRLALSWSIQRRPYYQRSIISAVYGYGWTLKNGARFTINPADINVVSVPWIDSTFLKDITNPYLRNSYASQLIAGLSANYYYTTDPDFKRNSLTFRVSADFNGNLIYGLCALFNAPRYTTSAGDQYYNLFGLRFAQYARASVDISQRINVGQRSQLAWRFLLAGGIAYGNSRTLPFERLFFAGGSNSMRGWQVRTLGPGSAEITESDRSYPNQLGDIRMEANFEYRVNVAGGLNLALFVDCGNIWMNGVGEQREGARFKFSEFYKQLALNTGAGIRYDFGYFLLRLDWGFKLHNPNNPVGDRWFKNLGINDTALHFAIGLPF